MGAKLPSLAGPGRGLSFCPPGGPETWAATFTLCLFRSGHQLLEAEGPIGLLVAGRMAVPLGIVFAVDLRRDLYLGKNPGWAGGGLVWFRLWMNSRK